MAALIVVLTLILALVVLLLAGLLRSHAEILRRLNALEQGGGRRPVGGEPERPDWLPGPRSTSTPAHDVAGVTLRGEPVHVGVRNQRASTLLAFLTSGCASCRRIWEALDPAVRPAMPGGARVVVVTKDPSHESPSKLLDMAPPDVLVVMSSAAWDAYEVPQSPYFIYVDGGEGEVAGEGSAGTWDQVLSLLRDAMLDAGPGNGRGSESMGDRIARADAELASAGIGPGHPSLYAGEDEEPRARRRSSGGEGG